MKEMKSILDKWFQKTAEVLSGEGAQFLTSENDQFRNPVGHVLRENLAVLLRELLGEMDSSCTGPALQAIGRLHAVQDLTAAKAVSFIFTLRPIVHEVMPGLAGDRLNHKIDQLALLAFEGYVSSIQQLCEIRVSESRRAMAVPTALSQRRA